MDEPQKEQVEATPVQGAVKNKKWIIVAIVIVALLLLGRTFFSPERAAERMLERATGGEYDVNKNGDGNIKISGKDGEEMNISTGNDVTLPENWPDSIPLLPDAKIGYAGSVSDGSGGTGLTLTYTTSRNATEATNFYKDELASKGWTISATLATGEGSMISATNSSDEGVAVYVAESDGVTTVNVNTQTSQ